MCGISGTIGIAGSTALDAVIKMNSRMLHRGPDNGGTWQHNSVCLGQRRLAIIDVSTQGHQPMLCANGRYAIVFNGEIYNYLTLKKELQNQIPTLQFNSTTDTEVLLYAYQYWGENMLQKLEGMFAFAIYDTVTETTFIARDRFGVKPLYYIKTQQGLVFASEIRALLASGYSTKKLNYTQLATYTQYQTVYDPNTLIEDISSLEAAHCITLSNGDAVMKKYYNPINAAQIDCKDDAATTQHNVLDLLSKSVQKRMISDVPLGAFLSGGIDSSAIVALMRKATTANINTFSVVFNDDEYSEERYAKIIADKYETKHTVLRLTPNDFKNDLPYAVNSMDSPSGDGPNTYVVSKATKEAGVTVALSGIGGDELFAGYDVFKRYQKIQSFKDLWLLPTPILKGVGTIIEKIKPSIATSKLKDFMSEDKFNVATFHRHTRNLFSQDMLNQMMIDRTVFLPEILSLKSNKRLTEISLAEISTYLQPTLLRDTDQMSMANSLEVREPFLDHHLVNYVLSINDFNKYPHTPKQLLVKAMGSLLPTEIVNRPKMGFNLPWNNWMRNELKTYCEERLQHLNTLPAFKNNAVMRNWQAFLNNSATNTWSRQWHLVVLSNWITENEIQV
ncbi:MAG: asparagine synthase (glutamine-hydrolyzing) [Bacteroidia bacterium]|nr:asparagine synthase (glutamine-hydrolyzing) [Bacteroidia bacterium]